MEFQAILSKALNSHIKAVIERGKMYRILKWAKKFL